jgi:CRISPR system Cascade subunit CasC
MTKDNLFKGVKVEYHILQSFPVSCLNRDDVGAPKTANVGGVPRARISSQCWKRQVRMVLHEMKVPIGIRTKKVNKKLLEMAVQDNYKPQDVEQGINDAVNVIAEDTLLFLSETEIKNLYTYLKDSGFKGDSKKINENEINKALGAIRKEPLEALDIALFGRMVAKAATLNIEAASSFNHAISTHKVVNEIDFFSALDDLSEEGTQGAAHLGTLEYNSATYYRYVSLDLGQLYENLGEDKDAVEKAIDVFTKALFIAVPAARQHTQSAVSGWDYAKILVRKGQGVQIHFETPVKAEKDGGFLKPSIQALNKELEKKEGIFGSLYGKKAEFTFGEDPSYSIDKLCSQLQEACRV